MTAEIDIAVAAAASPLALVALATYMLTRLRQFDNEIMELKKKLEQMDRKIDELLSLIKYVEGRVNGIDKRWQGLGRECA